LRRDSFFYLILTVTFIVLDCGDFSGDDSDFCCSGFSNDHWFLTDDHGGDRFLNCLELFGVLNDRRFFRLLLINFILVSFQSRENLS
jgi:hypothetical protein